MTISSMFNLLSYATALGFIVVGVINIAGVAVARLRRRRMRKQLWEGPTMRVVRMPDLATKKRKPWRCRLRGCECRFVTSDLGCCGQCVYCGRSYGFMSRAELRALIDRRLPKTPRGRRSR